MDLLFLAHRAPRAPDRGDRIRSWHILSHLAAHARVHLVALDEDASPPPPALTAMLASCTIVPRTMSRAVATARALATSRPVLLTAWDSAAVRQAVARLREREPIAATFAYSVQMAAYLPDDGSPAVMDFVDVDSLKYTALAEAARGPMRWLYAREARLLGAYERAIATRVDAGLFVSAAEAALFRAGGGGGRIEVVENGVDTAHFDPAAVEPRRLDRPTIVFTGQMDYAPNVEAVTRFARDILPLVRTSCPDAAFAIVGRAPTPAVRALASPSVTITGEVADPRPWLAAAEVCVAPLRLARGIQNKVLEAMAMARPVVASGAAAEGIDHAGTIRVADDDAAFAAAVVALLADREVAARLGTAARAQVERRYGWPARLAPLDALLGIEPIRAGRAVAA